MLTAAALGARLGLPGVEDVETEAGRSGWVRTVRVETSAGVRSLPATAFARRLGLRSQSFRVGMLRLGASSPATVFGHRVLLHGLARGLRAHLEFRHPGRAWQREALPRPWFLVRPGRTTEYRLVASGVATSPVQVDVAPALLVNRHARRLAGRVLPGVEGLAVSIQRLLAGSWLTIRQARLRPTGDFRLLRSLPSGIYRAKTAATRELLATASSPIRVP